MARKKKKAVRRKGRARRMSAVGSIDFNQLLYSGAGGFAAKLIDRVLPTTWDARMVAGGKLAVGIALPMLSKDAKTKKMLSDIGSGMVAVSIVDLMSSFGFMQGIGFPSPSPVQELAVVIDRGDRLDRVGEIGADVLGADVLGANDDIPVMNGMDDDDDDIAVMNGVSLETGMEDLVM